MGEIGKHEKYKRKTVKKKKENENRRRKGKRKIRSARMIKVSAPH